MEYDLEIATFEELIEDNLTQFRSLIDRLLLRIPAAKIQGIELLGENTRIPSL